jgi:predicted kinase
MKLWIIAGMPATGKSWIAGILHERFGYPVIEKDRIKERMFNAVGFEEYSVKLGEDVAANFILPDMVRKFAEAGQSLIIKNNFDQESGTELGQIIEEYSIDAATLFMTGDPQVLYERYFARDAAHKRHLGHCMQTHYPPHEGESTEFQMTREGFAERFLKRKNDVMSWRGKRIDVDTTGFEKVDVESLIAELS